MAEINEEFIAEYARVIGNAYTAINKGIGDENTPGSAIFNLNQLSYLAEKKLPAFGIVQTNTSNNFEVTVDENDQTFIKVSSGKIAYFDNLINVPAQRIPIAKTFANAYNSTDVYGIRIGFPFSEAQKTTSSVYSSVLKQNVSISDNIIYVENPQRIINLGFPITAYVGTNTYVVFDGCTSDRTGFYISPSINGGFLNQSFDKGTTVNFIYEPKIKALTGIPVGVVSHDPAEFKYFPPLPSSWLPIADVLVLNPNNPEVDTFGSDPAILRTAIDYPAATVDPPLFSQTDTQTILKFSETAKNQLKNNKRRASVSDAIKALEFYTSALQTSSGKTFRQFWASRPLAKSTYYNKGVNYEGLERFEFSDSFADAYYQLNNKDLNRTYAIFRGDLYQNPSTIYGSPPSSLTLSNISDFKGISSTLTTGTYYYGVSAVLTTGETRETPVTFASLLDDMPNSYNYVNLIQWTPVTDAQFYHIYRKSSQSGEQIEYRLTEKNTIKGAGPISNPSITPNTTVNLSTTGIAFKITPTGASEMHLGGIYFKLKATDKTLINTSDYVSVSLYTNDALTNKPGTVINTATFDTITFENILRANTGELTEDFKKIILKTNYKMTSGVSYWVVLTLSNAPSSGYIQIHVSNAAATGKFATYTGGVWTLVNTITPFYELLGFIDNGIAGTAAASKGLYLTRKVTKEPRRLRIYLPEISSFPYSGPIIGENANTSESTITKNEMIVTITAQNGTDDPVVLPQITIPQSTTMGTQFLVGTASQLFDRVLDVQVVPGANVVRGLLNSILWSKYDTFIVENVP
ncbi:MAG: hypothetical protein RLZZ196_837 [Bacteroidota bacterium]|jgi:hypothetical protein